MLIDWTRVHELRAEIGHDGFGEVVAMFLEESDSIIASASGPLAPDELHFLKGAALNLGFSDLAEACATASDTRFLVQLYESSKASLLAEVA